MRMSLREIAIKRPIACSETSIELQPAALQMIRPWSLAALRSMRSTPTPVRATTLVRFNCAMISRVSGTEPCMMMPSASLPISVTSASLVGRRIVMSASISAKIGLIRSPGTSFLPKYTTWNLPMNLNLQSEQAHRIVPKYFPPRFARNTFIVGEIADRALGKFADAVAVRIIGGDGQVVGAHVLDKSRRQLLAGFAARPALALEIVARFFPGGARPAVAFVLPVLVHPFEPERHPAAARFQIS